MKKFFLALLALTYITTSSGMAVTLHYCMGKLVTSGIFHDKDDACDTCGMTKSEKNKCCKDEVKLLKVDNDQKAPNALFLCHHAIAEVNHQSYFDALTELLSDATVSYPLNNSPPEKSSTPLFVLYGNFRI